MNKDFLFELIKTPSPSGAELNIQKVVMNHMKDYVDKFITHHSYNVISVINPDNLCKVLLSGHIDEIGLVVTDILDNGLIKVTNTGNSVAYMYIGQHVQIITKDKIINGVFGNTNNFKEGNLKISDLLLDIGTYSYEETKKLVNVGDYVVHKYNYEELENNKLSARALDNKLGAFIILEALKKAKANKAKVGIYACSSVGEETTGRGATFATTAVGPTCAIVVDVTHATDHNDRAKEKGLIKLGKGPAITLGSIINPKLLELLKQSAQKLNINLQYEISTERTYTDTDKIHFLEKGIPSLLISIPLRYMHSSVEVCDYGDVEDIINVIADMLINFDENIDFNPFN